MERIIEARETDKEVLKKKMVLLLRRRRRSGLSRDERERRTGIERSVRGGR